MTSYTEGFSHFVTSMTSPVASGWSDLAGSDSHPLESAALPRHTRCGYVGRAVGLSRDATGGFGFAARQLARLAQPLGNAFADHDHPGDDEVGSAQWGEARTTSAVRPKGMGSAGRSNFAVAYRIAAQEQMCNSLVAKVGAVILVTTRLTASG